MSARTIRRLVVVAVVVTIGVNIGGYCTRRTRTRNTGEMMQAEIATDPIVVRPAVAADQSEIVELVRLGNLPPYSLKWSHFMVAEKVGKIVGVGQIRKHGPCNELGSLSVHPDYRS